MSGVAVRGGAAADVPQAGAGLGHRPSTRPRSHHLRPALFLAFVALVIFSALPAFMLRPTGVMDDSVFWVVAKSLASGKVLYRDVFFTQPPLFIVIPQGLWLVTTNIYVHRVFLFVIWIVNGYLFYLTLYRVDRHLRLLATSLFLVSAFILQSYALHTEIFILTAFLVGMLAIIRAHPGAEFVLGLSASAALFVKLIGPIAFIPCVYYAILAVPRGACPPTRERRLALFLAGAVAPAVGVAAYLAWYGTGAEFWQQVVLDTSHLGLSINDDWLGYFTLAVAPLLVPVFVALILLDRRPADLEWWLTVLVFVGLLAVELVRGARHYGLFNLCVLAWMAVRAQDALNWRNHVQRTGLCLLLALAAIVQVGAVREILTRGWITNELSAAGFAESLPRGSLQVFANNPPRLYMLLNDLIPAYAYVFIYDTNNELLIWDSYRDMIDKSPPDYIAVEDNFSAIEYGQLRSAELTDATAVKTWLEYRGDYRQLDVGRALHVTMYQREFPSANFP